MVSERLNYLFEKYFNKKASAAERAELSRLLNDLENWDLLEDLLLDQYNDVFIESNFFNLDFGKDKILETISHNRGNYYLKNKYLNYIKYVVAASLLFFIGFYFLRETPQILTEDHKLFQDIPAGGNKAILTLGNGEKVLLDTLKVGNSVVDGNFLITKLSNGEISYKNLSSKVSETILNNIETPVGGTMQVNLPDGSKVWLNASTQLSYPLNFNKKERVVKLNGEAYFEIAKDKNRSFKVFLPEEKEIKVLGTHFNINTYDIGKQITTVTEGIVQVSSLKEKQLLTINEQAVFHNQEILKTQDDVNIEEILAWKNGFFSMHSISLQNLVNEIERWYGIQVDTDILPEKEFIIRLRKDISLKDLITIIELTGEVKFDLNNKILKIMSKT